MSSEEEQDPYGAIKFGEFRKYMQNKKSKLKNQQEEVLKNASQERIQLFQGCSIYINGYTNPPTNDLRRTIIEYGGDYQHYLKKLSVTHIIATNLTNSKIQEFRAYKVVKPEWITESVEKKQLQPWQNYRLVPRASKQKELLFNNEPPAEAPPPVQNEWQRSVSTTNPDFIKRYYETSRLHYLSTWKSELKDIIEKLEKKYPKSSQIGKKRKQRETRIIMHIDFDCFFASVGIKDRPHLKDKPVAVTHSKGASETSSSDIASCNYVARSFGLRNGMTIGTAKGLCPELQVIPYEFEKYRSISEMFYEIVFRYADEIKPVSVDEAFLDVGSHITACNEGQEELLAIKIRDEIRETTGCEASVGIGSNILLARMSTKKAKPAGQYFCNTKEDIDSMLLDTSVMDLPGVGYANREKLKEMNITTVAELREMPLPELQSKLGAKMGQTLFQFSRGIDDRPLATHQQRQSVSADVNWGMRFESEENEKEFVKGLSVEVSERLNKLGVKGKTITVKIMKKKEDAGIARKNLGHGIVDTFSKSHTLGNFTDDPEIINKFAYSMLKSFHFSHLDMRGFGIQITRLDNAQEPIISPDRGILKFNKTSHVTNQNEGESSTTRVEPISSTRKKEEMIVDYNVYNELPDSVRKELVSNYDLKFENEAAAVQNDDEEFGKEMSIPELPPWSQLDPESLLALPNDMRDKVIEAYRNNKSPPRSPHRENPNKASPSGSSNRNKTITELFSPTSDRLQREGLPYDVNVWNELPPDMRNELIAEHRDKQKRIVQEQQQQQQIEQQQKQQTIVVDKEIQDHLNDIEPKLQGLTHLQDIRDLLLNWVNQFDRPETEDLNTFCHYLIELVKISDLEKVRLLVIYLDHLALSKLSWKESIFIIKEKITDITISIYGYPLQF